MEIREAVLEVETVAAVHVSLEYIPSRTASANNSVRASICTGHVSFSVGSEKLGSRPTEEHERAVAEALLSLLPFARLARSFKCDIPYDYEGRGYLLELRDAERRLVAAGSSAIRRTSYQDQRFHGFALGASFEVRGVSFMVGTHMYWEAPQFEHEYVLAKHLEFVAESLEKAVSSTRRASAPK
jgi:hypothetical protein